MIKYALFSTVMVWSYVLLVAAGHWAMFGFVSAIKTALSLFAVSAAIISGSCAFALLLSRL